MQEVAGKKIPDALEEIIERTVLMGGVATEGGVEGTARTGHNLGYYVVVLKDCVGSRNREVHEMALNLMEKTQFDVATTNEVLAIWRRKM